MYHPFWPQQQHQPQHQHPHPHQQQQPQHPPFFNAHAPPQVHSAGPQRIHPPPGSTSSSNIALPPPSAFGYDMLFNASPQYYQQPRPLPLANQPMSRYHEPRRPPPSTPLFLQHEMLAHAHASAGFRPYTPPPLTTASSASASTVATTTSFNPAVFNPSTFYYPLPVLAPAADPPASVEPQVNALGLMRMDEEEGSGEVPTTQHHEHEQQGPEEAPPSEEGEEEISPALTSRLIDDDHPDEPTTGTPQDAEVEVEQDVEDGENQAVEKEDEDDAEYAPAATTAVKKSKPRAKGKGKKGKGRAKGKAKGKGKKKAPMSSVSPGGEAGGGGRRRQRQHYTTSDSSVCMPPSNTGWDGGPDDDILYALRNVQWPLMACTEGSLLEVNDLLILHPPALSPSHKDKHVPTNQYSRPGPSGSNFGNHSAASPSPIPGQSMFEMYTCRACRKTYDGKNARSVARRHLQDKHGIPLSKQARRTRWDLDIDRPKDAFEANERSKKCKRDWAKVYRQQRALEKLHADFLLQFGPHGLETSWKQPLVAPVFREIPPPEVDDNVIWNISGQVPVPPSILASVKILADFEACVEQDKSLPFVGFEDLLSLDEGFECPTKDAYAIQPDPSMSTRSLIGTSSATRPNRAEYHDPYTSTPGSGSNESIQDSLHLQHGPPSHLQAHSSFAEYIPEDLDEVSDQQIFDLLRADAAQQLALADHTTGDDEQLAPDANPNAEHGDEDEDEGLPLLMYPTEWHQWNHDLPSASNSSMARIAAELDRSEPMTSTDELLNHAGPSNATAAATETADDTAVALLDMYYSPPKPSAAAAFAAPRSTAYAQPGWIDNQAQLIAEYSSRPPIKHTKSLSTSVRQTFLHRPGHMQRSLSTATLLDDPFVLDQDHDQDQGRASRSHSNRHGNGESPAEQRRLKSTHTRPGMSSPLSERKRRPLSTLHSTGNSNGQDNYVNTNTPRPHSYTSSRLFSGNANDSSLKSTHSTSNGNRFVTPARPSARSSHPPESIGKYLKFSSPADPAASLGLVPSHAVPTTPGLSMIIGQDTPVAGGGTGGAKRRRPAGGAITPKVR